MYVSGFSCFSDFDDLVDAEEEHYRQLQEDNASQQDVDQILQELGEEGQGTVTPSQQKVTSDASNSQKLTQSHQLPAGLANHAIGSGFFVSANFWRFCFKLLCNLLSEVNSRIKRLKIKNNLP